MGKFKYKPLIAACALILVGIILFGGAMTVLKWDFKKLSTVTYENRRHEISDDFRNISINADTADIVFALSDTDTCIVECYEETNVTHSVSVQDHALVIENKDTRAWYEHIGIFTVTPSITIYLPKSDFGALSVKGSTGDIEVPKSFTFESTDISISTGDINYFAPTQKTVKLKTTTGDICVQNITTEAMDISVSTGHVSITQATCSGDVAIRVDTGDTKLEELFCKNLKSTGNTGDFTLSAVIVAESMTISRTTGDIKLNKSDANDITIKTNTGDVTGSLLSEKIFAAQTSTGKVHTPKSTTGGICQITTTTGDIKITIQ